ncbi:hypothetical protein IAD21_06118 [Abditibacteriota bacterium]|nr:hypothetical protein IAD21_06118 [Abditibacteriota bacterium]
MHAARSLSQGAGYSFETLVKFRWQVVGQAKQVNPYYGG